MRWRHQAFAKPQACTVLWQKTTEYRRKIYRNIQSTWPSMSEWREHSFRLCLLKISYAVRHVSHMWHWVKPWWWPFHGSEMVKVKLTRKLPSGVSKCSSVSKGVYVFSPISLVFKIQYSIYMPFPLPFLICHRFFQFLACHGMSNIQTQWCFSLEVPPWVSRRRSAFCSSARMFIIKRPKSTWLRGRQSCR